MIILTVKKNSLNCVSTMVVPYGPMKYWNEKFFGAHQHGGWLGYIDTDSMICWIIEKSQGHNDVRFLKISENVRANLMFASLYKVMYHRQYGECTHCPDSFSE